MKLVHCARTLWAAALASLALATAQAAQPVSVLRYQTSSLARISDGDDADSSDTEQPADAPMPDPEAIMTPPSAEDATGGPENLWDGYANGTPSGNNWNNGRFQRGLWYGGVDYLLFRPRMSQGVGEVSSTLVTSPGVSNQVSQSVQFPFRYQSGFRASLGYRLLNCGGDIQFTYWRMVSSAQINDGPASVADGSKIILGQLWNNPADGQFFGANTGIAANIFDLDFAKCLAFGGPRCPCDTCYCPRWDVRWIAGARLAEINRTDNNSVTDANANVVTTGNIYARFLGAGPRVGLQGRRYFRDGVFSIYARATQSLLIGNYHMSRISTTPGVAPVPTIITSQYDTFSRIVPVTDIEVGVSWQVAPYAFVSTGWFFQCWWDLGQGETIGGQAFPALDTSNILGFDGLFVRGEMLF